MHTNNKMLVTYQEKKTTRKTFTYKSMRKKKIISKKFPNTILKGTKP